METGEDIKLEKVSEYKWVIKKSGKMKVPVVVFASESLLNQMKKDRTLIQLRNMTELPGIYKHAICLPDGHQGYGFPIGGVAALDVHTGGISPGGIGYDINCLTPDTNILTSLGYYCKIDDLCNNDLVANNNSFLLYRSKCDVNAISFDKKIKTSKINYVMKKNTYKTILIIKTLLGRIIKCSKDHPILTDKGMIKAGELKVEDHVIINPFIGVKYEAPDKDLIIDNNSAKGQEKRELIKRGLLPLKEDNPKLPYIARLLGYLLGDGTIYFSGKKGFVNFYGKYEDLKLIQNDLRILGYSSKIYRRTRKCTVATQYGSKSFISNSCELHCSAKSLARLFIALGAPAGNKTRQDYTVPQWIMKSKLWIKRLFLSGFFSAELSKPKLMSKYNFYAPIISQNKSEKHIESMHQFLEQISDLLKEFDIKINKISLRKEHYNKHGENTYRLRLIIANDSDNLIKLYSKIGFDYNQERQKMGLLAVNYLLYKESVKNIRKELAKQAVLLKNKGLSIAEILTEINSDIINKRFVERSVWGGRKTNPRPYKNFITFEEFTDKTVFREYLVKDKIISIKEEKYDGLLYDLNVNDESHNFVANSFIVSNCGVRMYRTNLKKEDVLPKINKLLDVLYENVPCGVGVGGKLGKISIAELNKILDYGAKWALDNGYALKEDLTHTENEGSLEGDHTLVSQRAIERGRPQLGSLGAGNHFLEVQVVDKIYDYEVAKAFGIEFEGQVTGMIHCGSRGLGHQVCSDYLRMMERAHPEIVKTLPDRELIYAPAGSKIADEYFKAMNAAANYAWTNRQLILHWVREAFEKVFGKKAEDLGMRQIYDVCHNICKIEEHVVDGKRIKAYVHRKGATRAMPKGHPLVPKTYKDVGQPVLIPGTMGTASYVLVGGEKALEETFGSTAHGAGRVLSRHAAIKKYWGETVKKELKSKGIAIKARSMKGISEESPGAYKDIDEVVKVSDAVGIGKLVARLVPLGVIKG